MKLGGGSNVSETGDITGTTQPGQLHFLQEIWGLPSSSEPESLEPQRSTYRRLSESSREK